jgi:hypothetical protein
VREERGGDGFGDALRGAFGHGGAEADAGEAGDGAAAGGLGGGGEGGGDGPAAAGGGGGVHARQLTRRLALSQRDTKPRVAAIHSTFERMGMRGALDELRRSLLASLGPADRVRVEALPPWLTALEFQRAENACNAALHPGAAHAARHALRTIRHIQEVLMEARDRGADAEAAPPSPGSSGGATVPAPAPPAPIEGSDKRLAATVRLAWGALLEIHAAQLALDAFEVDDVPPHAMGAPPPPKQHAHDSEGAEVALLWHHSYCAAVWTSAHAEYLATIDELVTGAAVQSAYDVEQTTAPGGPVADGSALPPEEDPTTEAELLDALLIPPPELYTVPTVSGSAQLHPLFERPVLAKSSPRAAHIMHALLTRACNAGTRGWEATLASATQKEADGVMRICMHSLGVALTGMHPALHPAARPPWCERLVTVRLWAAQAHTTVFKDVVARAPLALKEVTRLHLGAILHEDPTMLEALRATGQPAGQLLLPPRSVPPHSFVAAMRRLAEAGTEFVASGDAAASALSDLLAKALVCEGRPVSRHHRPVSDGDGHATLAYNSAWLGGRANAPAPTCSAVEVVSGLLSASFRSLFVPFWIHGQRHGRRASRLDETQFVAVHEHNPAYMLLKDAPRRVFGRMLRVALETPDADLMSVASTLARLNIETPDAADGAARVPHHRQKRSRSRAGGGAAPAPARSRRHPSASASAPLPAEAYAAGLASPSASRIVQDSEREILNLGAADATLVFVFARFCALRAQLLSFDLGPRTLFLQARAVCERLGVMPDAEAGETYESVARTRLPKHATACFVCNECKRIANAIQDNSGKKVAFNEVCTRPFLTL